VNVDADALRTIERARLRSLVDVDLAAADVVHADDYQLITPRGHALTKAQYLGSIQSGELDYSIFEPVSEIAVWGHDGIALLRYHARIAFHNAGRDTPFTCWHTDCYELRDQGWQAVWSQATAMSDD
jgi:Domain of unknown function (DUF4440)